MTSLFAESHNMVAILEKSDAAQGFEQIIDFLSGSYIYHALTVNPHVYISCIKQFWNTAVVKCSGDVTRLQALVDKKRIVISEEVVREILQLNDAEGVICLPNDEIFVSLARMGYENPSTKLTFYKAFFSTQWKFFIHTILHSLSAKRTSWNEFSSAMASALICLSSCQRVGKRFSGVKTPLFEDMLVVRAVGAEEEVHVPAQDDVVQEHVTEEIATEVVPPTPTSPSPSSLVIPSLPHHQSPCPPQPQAAEGSSHLVQQVLEKCSTLVLRVKGLETANAAQQLEIIKLKARVKKLERLNKVKSSKLRRLKKVGTSQRVESSEDVKNVFNQGRISVDMDERIELVVDQEKSAKVDGRQADTQAEIYNIDLDHSSKVLSMQEDTDIQEAIEVVTTAKLITVVVTAATTQVVAASAPIPAAKPVAKPKAPTVKDKGKRILIEDPKPMKKKDQIEMDAEFKKKPQSESEARKNMISYLKNTKGYKMEFFKGKTYDQILPIFQARAAKRRKLSEEGQEANNLRGRLEIVEDKDDDVFVKAIPLT
nr:hypothetical protein [Tanacetum cinerariifolium]